MRPTSLSLATEISKLKDNEITEIQSSLEATAVTGTGSEAGSHELWTSNDTRQAPTSGQVILFRGGCSAHDQYDTWVFGGK